MTDALVPAAQYLRMSTEHQQYSLDNQSVAIQKYAAENGFRIFRTYVDNSRSGIVLTHRDGLRQLLDDIVRGPVPFRAVLVYDVSRWGRFQDTDESAHYEFLCRSAGIPIHYCAEQFCNDGTATNTLIKTIKRLMAAEYSRELGVKVAAGQRNVFMKGFRGGGSVPGFGLRRMLVSPDGAHKQLMAEGERKALQSDRVVLVPGPDDEVAWVKEIFRLFIDEKRSYRGIATVLNRNGVPYRKQRPWDLNAVRRIVTNGKYNGVLTYGMGSQRLHTKFRKMPESQWLVVAHPSCKIVDEATFGAARARIESFTTNKSDAQMLEELRGILAAKGRLSAGIICGFEGATSPFSYRCRFGSLQKAFQLIGYSGYADKALATRKRVQEMRRRFMEKLRETFPDELSICGDCGKGKSSRKWLQMRDGTKISVRFCIQPVFVTLKPLWRLSCVVRESGWINLVALLNRENTEIVRLLLYPSVPSTNLSLPVNSSWLKEGIEVGDIGQFCQVVRGILGTP